MSETTTLYIVISAITGLLNAPALLELLKKIFGKKKNAVEVKKVEAEIHNQSIAGEASTNAEWIKLFRTVTEQNKELQDKYREVSRHLDDTMNRVGQLTSTIEQITQDRVNEQRQFSVEKIALEKRIVDLEAEVARYTKVDETVNKFTQAGHVAVDAFADQIKSELK